MPLEHRMATVNGIRVHYVQEGEGPPVVLLHGWPQTWYCWRRLLPPLAERFTVIAPDLRGYGLSDKPPGGYDKRTMAGDVRAFSAPGAMRAAFDDYRATYPDDLDADEASAAAGERLTMPLLALWGATGLTGRLPVLDIWRDYASDVQGEAIQECGHFLPEEQPELVAERLLRFLG